MRVFGKYLVKITVKHTEPSSYIHNLSMCGHFADKCELLAKKHQQQVH
jgi:hypothetical protein